MKKKSKFLNYFALSHFIKQKLLMSEKWVETTANKSFALLLKIPIEVAFFFKQRTFSSQIPLLLGIENSIHSII